MGATNAVKPFGQARDYSGGQIKPTKRFEMRQGDPRVHALFVEFTNFPKRAATWGFQRRLVDLAQELFTGEYSWFIRQDSNALLKDQNYAFVLDTVRYIATGRRKFSIHTWPALLTYEVPVVNESVSGRRDIYLLTRELKLPNDTNTMLQMWLAHPGGIDDLMYTVHMLFGNVHEKISSEQYVDISEKIAFLEKCRTTLEGYITEQTFNQATIKTIDKACKLNVGNESFDKATMLERIAQIECRRIVYVERLAANAS